MAQPGKTTSTNAAVGSSLRQVPTLDEVAVAKVGCAKVTLLSDDEQLTQLQIAELIDERSGKRQHLHQEVLYSVYPMHVWRMQGETTGESGMMELAIVTSWGVKKWQAVQEGESIIRCEERDFSKEFPSLEAAQIFARESAVQEFQADVRWALEMAAMG